LIAAAVVVGIGGVFFMFVTRSDMWLDETLSVNIAHLPLHDLRDALRHDGAPPLYYVLLHFWTSLFGTGNAAARSLSGLCMLAAVVVVWFIARRWQGRRVAWFSVLVMLTNPYAFRYATEARMYALEILLVACGTLAFQRTVERATWGRAALFGVVVAASIYTQYWSFYMLVIATVLIVWMLWRNLHRDAARRLAISGAVGLLVFLPWVPTFLYQSKHTGTPWGSPVLPGVPLFQTLRDFSGGATATGIDVHEGALLFLLVIPLLLLGVFARPLDDRHLEIDVRVQPEARAFAFVGGFGLVVALSLNYLAGGAFQTRYSSIVYPFFVLLVARGLSTLRDVRILAPVAAVMVVLGFAGGVRNVQTQRTQAGEVAAILRKEAKPGDLVVYCPDQVGPAVHRLAPKGLDEVTYPRFDAPVRIDWVDYKKRLAHVDRAKFARDALARADDHTLWYVAAPGYTTHTGVCEGLADDFAKSRTKITRTLPDPKIFEKPALTEYRAKPSSG
jgi:hypothetical protein